MNEMATAMVEAMMTAMNQANDKRQHELEKSLERVELVIESLSNTVEDLNTLYMRYEELVFNLENRGSLQLQFNFDDSDEADIMF